LPINQADLARTLLDFTYVPIRAMGRLGVDLRPHERDDVHHLFRYIAHLLGIDPALQVDDHAGATNLAALLEMVTPPPDEGSRALVDALLEAYAQLLTPVLHTPEGMTRELVLALAQIFHGAPVCRRLVWRRRRGGRLPRCAPSGSRTPSPGSRTGRCPQLDAG
jgi:mpaB/rubber oxygenase-like protein